MRSPNRHAGNPERHRRLAQLQHRAPAFHRSCAAHDDGRPSGWISRYAWGDDYHEVLRERLDALVESLRERFTGPFEARAYVDTGPVQERVLAKYAGLGWLGKNTLLLNQMLGSFFFWVSFSPLSISNRRSG